MNLYLDTSLSERKSEIKMLTDLAKVDLRATIGTGIHSGLNILSEHQYLVFAVSVRAYSLLSTSIRGV